MNTFVLTGDKKRDSVLLWILFNVLRLIPIALFSIPFFIFYALKALFNRSTFLSKKELWDMAYDKDASIFKLISFAKISYKYKYDFGKGFCDHDSSYFEWIMAYGDCDDMALYAKKALKNRGYEAIRIGLLGHDAKHHLALHFDCMYKCMDGVDVKYCLFNYGNIVSGSTPKEALMNLGNVWAVFSYDTTKYCKCLF